VNFRVVATERRYDKTADDWVDGDEFGVTVVCWRTLASAVLNTVRKGDPVIVAGRIATRRFEKNGVMQYFTEVKADFVGLDVARAGARFTRNPMDTRESVEQVAGDPRQVSGSDGSAPDVDLESSDDEFHAPWDAEEGAAEERNGVLASSG
jgi:single-strand DNA-binding protein